MNDREEFWRTANDPAAIDALSEEGFERREVWIRANAFPAIDGRMVILPALDRGEFWIRANDLAAITALSGDFILADEKSK